MSGAVTAAERGGRTSLRVLVVDDYDLYRRGVAAVLAGEPDLMLCGEAGTMQQAVEEAERLRPDIVLLDVYLPDGDGPTACRRIIDASPGIQVLMVTASDDGDDVARAVQAGAVGYLLKDVGPDQLVAAIRGAARSEAQLSPSLGSLVMGRYARLVRGETWSGSAAASAHGTLTERELEVLALVGRGMSNQAVADELFISQNTVRNHVRSILGKLEVDSRVQAATYAARHDLVAELPSDGVGPTR